MVVAPPNAITRTFESCEVHDVWPRVPRRRTRLASCATCVCELPNLNADHEGLAALRRDRLCYIYTGAERGTTLDPAVGCSLSPCEAGRFTGYHTSLALDAQGDPRISFVANEGLPIAPRAAG